MINKFDYNRGFLNKGRKTIELECPIPYSSLSNHFDILLLPVGTYSSKTLIVASLNLFSESVDNCMLDMPKYGSNSIVNGIALKHMEVLRELASFTQYYINSRSWYKQKIEDCDHYEFLQRLQLLISTMGNNIISNNK